MTRTWLTRLFLIAPLVAAASAGFAQTAAPVSPEPVPAAAPPLAPTSGTPAATPKPVPKPALPVKPATLPDAGAPAKPATAVKPAPSVKPATAPQAGHPALTAPAHPATPGTVPHPGVPAATLKPIARPAAPHAGGGGASGTAAARPRPVPVPGAVAKPAAPLGAAGSAGATIARPGLAPKPAPQPRPATTPGGAAVVVPRPAGALAPRPPGTSPLGKPVLLVPVAVAAVPAAPAFKPAPELDQLKFLRGRWRCDGKQFASPMFGPEHTFTAVAEGKSMVDGFWDQYTYEERKTKDHHGLKVQGQWGWDQGAKHLVRVAVTNAGDWDSGTAPGLEGDKIIWTGEFSGLLGRMPYRHTFTKKSDKEWTHALELKDPTGKFTPTNEVTCKR